MRYELVAARADEIHGEKGIHPTAAERGYGLARGDGELEVQQADGRLERRLRQPALRDDDLLALRDVVADEVGDRVTFVAEAAQGGAERLRGGTIRNGRPHEARLLARDEDVLVVLARAPARSPVDVPAESLLELEAGALEDLGIQVAAVVHDDEHGRARRERGRRIRERVGDPLAVLLESRLRRSLAELEIPQKSIIAVMVRAGTDSPGVCRMVWGGKGVRLAKHKRDYQRPKK